MKVTGSRRTLCHCTKNAGMDTIFDPSKMQRDTRQREKHELFIANA
jgi:hypothetical protein